MRRLFITGLAGVLLVSIALIISLGANFTSPSILYSRRGRRAAGEPAPAKLFEPSVPRPVSELLAERRAGQDRPLRDGCPRSAALHAARGGLLNATADVRPWKAIMGSTWFGGDMPYWSGQAVHCPEGVGCDILMLNEAAGRAHRKSADLVAFHPNGADDIFLQPVKTAKMHPRQLIALMSSELFTLPDRQPSFFLQFSNEIGMRPSSFVRDTYVLWFLNDAHKQGLAKQKPFDTSARVWADIFEDPLPPTDRNDAVVATWASHYCSGSRSGREDLVRELMHANLTVAVYGGGGNCLKNTPETEDRLSEFRDMRRSRFHLAFENARFEGYVSEKFYWAILRGQVPVVWGSPDIGRYAPSPDSYVDASTFPDAASLSAHLQRLAADDEAYGRLHAWRHTRSFADFGDVLREELLPLIEVAARTFDPPTWYACRLCTALESLCAAGGFEPEALAKKIEPMACMPPWLKREKASGGG